MSLSLRLETLIHAITPCGTVLDIGCDHGLLEAALISTGRVFLTFRLSERISTNSDPFRSLFRMQTLHSILLIMTVSLQSSLHIPIPSQTQDLPLAAPDRDGRRSRRETCRLWIWDSEVTGIHLRSRFRHPDTDILPDISWKKGMIMENFSRTSWLLQKPFLCFRVNMS